MAEIASEYTFATVKIYDLDLLQNEHKKSFIYFLINEDDEIIYIGQTTCLFSRISAHQQSKKFVKVKYFIVPSEISNEAEAEAIIMHKPFLNYNIPSNKKYTYLEWFQRSHPCLKGKMHKVKRAVRKLNIKHINGYYLIEDLKQIIPIIEKGEV
jgi:excinuclease UvrABC nuclease subunit